MFESHWVPLSFVYTQLNGFKYCYLLLIFLFAHS